MNPFSCAFSAVTAAGVSSATTLAGVFLPLCEVLGDQRWKAIFSSFYVRIELFAIVVYGPSPSPPFVPDPLLMAHPPRRSC